MNQQHFCRAIGPEALGSTAQNEPPLFKDGGKAVKDSLSRTKRTGGMSFPAMPLAFAAVLLFSTPTEAGRDWTIFFHTVSCPTYDAVKEVMRAERLNKAWRWW